MKQILSIFRIRREERWLAIVTVLVFLLLNAMVVCRYYNDFTRICQNYWPVFVNKYHVSGFDPITYCVLSNWDWNQIYNVFRHPLLAFFLYIPNQLNQGLMMLTGINCAQFIMAAMLILAVMYSVVFLYRIFRDVIGLNIFDGYLLTAFMYSFAYVMISYTVPDHFGLSLTMLLLVLWVSGISMKSGKQLTILQTVVLFFFTAGISLNNGIKVFLANLFSNGKRFFRLRNLLLAIIVPTGAIWYVANLEFDHGVHPRQMEIRKEVARKKAILKKKGIKEMAFEKDLKKRQAVAKKHTGKPFKKGRFWDWMDITTSRWDTAVENLFGESIQLHRDYLLLDTLIKRPVIVRYKNAVSYIVEGVIVALFVLGIWCGRKSKFFWLVMSFFLFDMALHMGLGFGINEVYIMGAHWLFAIPIAVAFLFLHASHKVKIPLRCLLLGLTAYLWISNAYLYAIYLFS